MSQTLASYIANVRSGQLDPQTVVNQYLQRAQSEKLWAYLTVTDTYAQSYITNLDVSKLPLAGAPICLKDNICVQWVRTTCASKILENYIAPYNATCRAKLHDAGATLIAKANMDEFAMGSSNENSAYTLALNPHDPKRIAWWSSGWVAVAVAADLCLAWLGTDTGGSVRQPSALCGVVGIKPTYGRVSRYGVMPMANSLDQVGVIAKTVQDAQIMLSTISGYDPLDAQSIDQTDYLQRAQSISSSSTNLKWVKIALFQEFFGDWLDPQIADMINQLVFQLQDQWAIVETISFPLLQYCLPVYYILNPAEVSTNLSRMDGIKYGLQKDTVTFSNLKDYITAIRSEGLGEEARRRIMVGTYVLTSKHFQDYYLQANKMRTLLTDAMMQIFVTYDVVLSPTSPEVAREIGRKSSDPVAMYLADIYTILANLTGIPAISIPRWFGSIDDVKLPMAYQLMAAKWKEDTLFRIGAAL